jgi:excisionase family DNA binding protein
MSDEHDILTVEEVARYLRVTERHIYKLLSTREIPAFKVGGAWRFRKEEVDRWIVEQERN